MGEDMREIGAQLAYFVQPVKDIHLRSHLVHEMGENGDIKTVYIFSAIAILILLIACINFVNLSTARASKRALEVGIRKVFGANKKVLFRQILGETFLLSLFSLVIAIVVIEFLSPVISKLAGGDFGLGIFDHWVTIPVLILFLLIVTMIAGFYPGIYISAYNPLKVMKGNLSRGSGKPVFRNIMVTVQFIITIFLIGSTIVIYRQLGYTQRKNLGVNLDQVVVAPLRNQKMVEQYKSLKGELQQIAGVKDVTAFSAYVGNFQQRRGYWAEGKAREDMWMIRNIQVDYNYLDMMDVHITQGRNFSPTIQADSAAIIVNQALVEEAGWTDPIGKHIGLPGPEGEEGPQFRVIGITNNFNYASLHEQVKPLVIHLNPNRFGYIGIKIDPANESSTIAMLTEKWESLYPGYPFDYFILEEKFKQLYFSEKQMAGVFTNFTYLAIFIACLGLFGLVSFITGQRTKEIGIRKVLGSSINEIISLFNKNFIVLVIIASVISIPLAWYAMHEWLQNFAYHTRIEWWIFVISMLCVLVISIITVSIQSYRAATKNPVEAIKYE
jgi:putative ABC transport system permease protein